MSRLFPLSVFMLLACFPTTVLGAGVIQDGFYLTYDAKQLRLVENYEALKRNGPLFEYFPDGDVHKIFQYENSLREGYALGYYTNNALYFRARFHEGQLHGPSQRYYINGELAAEISYRFGQPHGVARFYSETGRLEKVALYDNGRLVRMRPCDKNGRLTVAPERLIVKPQ